jgi:hypothetical protein
MLQKQAPHNTYIHMRRAIVCKTDYQTNMIVKIIIQLLMLDEKNLSVVIRDLRLADCYGKPANMYHLTV